MKYDYDASHLIYDMDPQFAGLCVFSHTNIAPSTAISQTPQVGPANPKTIPNVPPHPQFCSAYRDGSGAGEALYNLCMGFPNNPWSNCVRGKLLNQYPRNPNPFQLLWYLVPDHPYDSQPARRGGSHE
jgi:hypothetical protein